MLDKLQRVDDRDGLGHRVDPKRGPRQFEETHRREHLHLNALIVSQELHGVLGNDRRARHRIDDPTMLGRLPYQAIDDRDVHLSECLGRFVHVVKGPGSVNVGGRRMHSGTQPHRRIAI